MSNDAKGPWTMPLVPFAREFYGLSRSGAYIAARRGDIPVRRVGNKWLGLVKVAKEQLSKLAETKS
jgi:hypothetical protein